VLHVLPGGGDLGSALVTDANVQAVSFTGSTKAGQSVGELGGRHSTRVQLELGGNNALIVMGDADLDRTVAAAARGSFFNAGQGCMVIGRHLVHESVYDEYVDKLAATADGLTVGNPATADVDLGPIIDERQRDQIHSLVTGSITADATLRTDIPGA
jgi:benzaldehyde dehydrogenase (NAD)